MQSSQRRSVMVLATQQLVSNLRDFDINCDLVNLRVNSTCLYDLYQLRPIPLNMIEIVSKKL